LKQAVRALTSAHPSRSTPTPGHVAWFDRVERAAI
jgi:hypothetical protein